MDLDDMQGGGGLLSSFPPYYKSLAFVQVILNGSGLQSVNFSFVRGGNDIDISKG